MTPFFERSVTLIMLSLYSDDIRIGCLLTDAFHDNTTSDDTARITKEKSKLEIAIIVSWLQYLLPHLYVAASMILATTDEFGKISQ